MDQAKELALQLRSIAKRDKSDEIKESGVQSLCRHVCAEEVPKQIVASVNAHEPP